MAKSQPVWMTSLLFIKTGSSMSTIMWIGSNLNLYPFILSRGTKSNIVSMLQQTCITSDTSWFSMGRIPEAQQERGGAMNGKMQEKLEVSHTAIGFPWGFTQSRSNFGLSYICKTWLISAELWLWKSETCHPVFITGKILIILKNNLKTRFF